MPSIDTCEVEYSLRMEFIDFLKWQAWTKNRLVVVPSGLLMVAGGE